MREGIVSRDRGWRLRCRTEAANVRFFNGNAFYDGTNRPEQTAWNEHGGGQMFVSAGAEERASFADAGPKHKFLYSRHHRSRYFCQSCHDVSNPVLANLPYNGNAAGGRFHDPFQPKANQPTPIATWSARFLSSVSPTTDREAVRKGLGPFAPATFETSHPGNRIASCQDWHMQDSVGVAANKNSAVLRPTDSEEHPNSGVPTHDMMGGNALVPRILASALTGSPNYDSENAAQLNQGAALLTLDLTAGQPLDPSTLLAASDRAILQLEQAAAIDQLDYNATTGGLAFRVQNYTGHKLISDTPKGAACS